MSLTRRLILSFAVVLLLSLVNIVAHIWGSQVRSTLFSELQAVMRDQGSLRELEQQLDSMYKKVRVVQTLVEAGETAPITESEAIEQINALNSMIGRVGLLEHRLDQSLQRPVAMAGIERLLTAWRLYLEPFVIEGQVRGEDVADDTFRLALQRLVELELALVDRASAINLSLNKAVVRISQITTGIFIVTLLLTVILAFHLVTFTLRSIKALHYGTQEWGRGNLEYQVPPLEGELGHLADSFNHMARNLRTAMNEVKAASARADSANQAKSSFLANMSHELRTPMNAVIGYSEMLLEEAEDDPELPARAIAPDMEKILSAGQHLLALINDVLDISKIESGKMTVYRERTDIGRLLDEVLATVQPMVEVNGNQIIYQNQLSDQHTETDVTRFRQIALNLLSNAAKFTRDGEIHVTVREIESSAEIEMSVQDNGIGMSAEQIEHIFEAFIQADLSTSKEYGGTGLGLTISKKFAELLGGDIEVQSELGKGSCFTFRLPRIYSVGARRNGDTPLTAPAPTHSTILVVDDDEAARELSARYLRQAGYSVLQANSGETALTMVADKRPDLIVLDVMMPEMDGWQVLEELHKTEVAADIPVVIQSMMSEREMGAIMHVSAYLLKPIDRDNLIAAVGRVLSEQREVSI